MAKLGGNLEPSKLKLDTTKPREISPSTEPNQFGQVHSAEEDYSAGKGVPSPEQSVRDHYRSDVDSGTKAQHHTLGNRATQAAPGDHFHDGTSGKKIGPTQINSTTGAIEPEWTIPTGATIADVVGLLHKFVEFREV